GLVSVHAVNARHSAADAVATRDEPLVAQADSLYAALSDADATAASTFLAAGDELPARRQRYVAALRKASLEVSALGRRAGDNPQAARAVATIAAALPVYSGLVETARANDRQGFPVGAAYLRQASERMRAEILPAAGSLYALAARRLAADQRTATG